MLPGATFEQLPRQLRLQSTCAEAMAGFKIRKDAPMVRATSYLNFLRNTLYAETWQSDRMQTISIRNRGRTIESIMLQCKV